MPRTLKTCLLITAAIIAVPTLPAIAQQQQPMRPANFGAAEPAKQGNWISQRMPWNGKQKPSSAPANTTSQRYVSPKQKREGQFSMGRLAEKRGQSEAAVSIYETLIKRDPKDPRPYHRLGVMAARSGNVKRSHELLSQAAQLNPQNPEILRDLGYLYYKNGKLDEAEQLYKKGMQLDPKHQGIINNYAMLLAEAKMYKDALELFKRGNDAAEAHANMGFMLAQMGHLDKAEKYFSHALTLKNDLKPAAHGLIQVASLKERADALRNAEMQLVDGGAKEGAARASLTDTQNDRPLAASRIDAAPRNDKVQVVTRVEPTATTAPMATTASPAKAAPQVAARPVPPAKRLTPVRVGDRAKPRTVDHGQASPVTIRSNRELVGVKPAPSASNLSPPARSQPAGETAPGPARQRNSLTIRSSSRTPVAESRSESHQSQPRTQDTRSQDTRSQDTRSQDTRSQDTRSQEAPPQPSPFGVGASKANNPASRNAPNGVNTLRDASSFKWSTSRFPTAQPTWTPNSDASRTETPTLRR